MAPPVESTFTLVLATADTIAAFAPAVVALRTRQLTWRHPVGQVAIGWLVIGMLGVLSYGRARLGFPPRSFPISSIGLGLFPLLLLFPTLAWIGARALRWRWHALVLSVVLWATAVATLGTGRIIMAAAFPVMALAMSILTALALGARAQRSSPDTMRREGWFWILLAHLVYFGVTSFRGPLVEALFMYEPNAVPFANDALQIVFLGVYLLLACGIHLAGRAPST